ncbi:flagellar hook-associated protein FlgL, partial [Salmonella enterica subsp. enterica serovar Typhi]|nr:flagellar hook-associated protein FlgL [Salmonella enterica subsp. enterica serovar Typhi]
MRVTQSMLSNNMLRNLSNSYDKLGKLQDQFYTQKKFTRPSDDPVAAMMGM